MRITCPNCGAQYEVPDEVIPEEGRDVQCSNCGDTWYQVHPDHADDAAIGETEVDAQPEQMLADDPGYDDSDDRDGDRQYGEPARSPLDSSVRDVLREEADREAELRASEIAGGLESQPELGLDGGDVNNAARRAEQARKRMSQLRDSALARPAATEDPATSDSRRGLLPDIEEINATLKSDESASMRNALTTHVEGAESEARKRGGFSRGFSISLIVVVALMLVYAKAPQISRTIPQLDPALNAYVAMLDQARFWLDARIGSLMGR